MRKRLPLSPWNLIVDQWDMAVTFAWWLHVHHLLYTLSCCPWDARWGGGYRSLWTPNNLGKAPDPHYMAPKPRFWLPLFSMAPLWCCLLLIKPVCRPIYTAAVHISVWFSLVLTCCNGVAESCEVTFLRRWLQGWKCCGPHFWATQSAAGKVYERRECDLATW